MMGCTMSVVLFVVAALLGGARASLVLKTQNYTFESLPDMPADFGPLVPPEGVEGLLVVADPPDGCQVLKPPSASKEAWIALIARSQRVKNCTFDVKVRNAEVAGAAAAIVYDDVLEALIIMSKPKDHKEEPGIPSVFISQRSGDILKRLMIAGESKILITPISDAIWVSLLMSTIAGFLAVTVVAATFYFLRRQRGRLEGNAFGYTLLRAEGMTTAQLRKLPVIIYDSGDAAVGGDEEDVPGVGSKGGGTLKTCAVCLEDYKDGDKLRVLPCNHRFHRDCIDQWLSTRKPLCPICKHDACTPAEDPEPPAAGGPSSTQQGPFGASPSSPQQQPSTAARIQRLLPAWLRRGAGVGQEGPDPGSQQPTAAAAAAPDASALPGQAPAAVSQGTSGPVRMGVPGRARGRARRMSEGGPSSVQATPHNFPGMHFVRMSGPDLEVGRHGSVPEIQADDDEAGPVPVPAVRVDDSASSSLTQPLLPSSS